MSARWAAIGVLLPCAAVTPHARQESRLDLDHVVVAVRDLDAATATFRTLGFTIKPGTPHANGIRNAHVKFRDGTEIELLTVGDPTDALTGHYRRLIDRADGSAFVALHTTDRAGTARRLRDAGLPARTERGLVTIDRAHALGFIFFGGRNRSPTDSARHFAHANGAVRLAAVHLAPDRPGDLDGLYAALGAHPDSGAIRRLPPSARTSPDRPIVAVVIEVADLERAVAALPPGWHSLARARSGNLASVTLPPSAAHGLRVILEGPSRAP